MDTQSLTQVTMFSGLEQVALQDLCRCLSPCQLRPGDILCRAGGAATSLFVLQRGVAEVVLESPGNGTGIRSVAMATATPGCITLVRMAGCACRGGARQDSPEPVPLAPQPDCARERYGLRLRPGK
jgi:hypothetical protein